MKRWGFVESHPQYPVPLRWKTTATGTTAKQPELLTQLPLPRLSFSTVEMEKPSVIDSDVCRNLLGHLLFCHLELTVREVEKMKQRQDCACVLCVRVSAWTWALSSDGWELADGFLHSAPIGRVLTSCVITGDANWRRAACRQFLCMKLDVAGCWVHAFQD